jgi:hypothetical protein
LGGRTMDCRRRESEGSRDEKILMVKLIYRKKEN